MANPSAALQWLQSQVPPGAFGAMVVRLVNPAIAFAVTVVLARALGAGAYGDYTLAVTVGGVLGLVALLGLEALTPRTLGTLLRTDPGTARRFLRWSTWAVLAMAAGGSAIAIVALAWNPMDWAGSQVSTTLVLMVGLPFAAWLRLGRARLQAVGRTAVGLAFEMPVWNTLLLAAGLMVLARPAWQDAPTFAAMHVGATVLAWAGVALAFRRHVPQAMAAVGPRPAWLNASLGLGAFAAVMFLLTGGDLFVVGTLLAPEETGRYAVVARSAALALIVLQPIQLVAAPRLAQAWAAGDRAEVERVGGQCLRASIALGVVFTLVFWVFGAYVLRIFGPRYEDALWALRWVSLAHVALAVVGPLGLVLRMVHQERAAVAVLLGALAITLPASIVATREAGIEGAGLVRVLVLIMVAVGLHVVVVRRTGLRILPWPRRMESR